MLKRLSILLTLLTLSELGQANTGLQFLTFSQLPRGTALGEAFTAVSGDITAAGFNPAGLAGLENIQFAFMHKAWIQDIYLDYGGLAVPVARSVFNLGLLVNSIPGIEIRNSATSEPLGTTDARDVSLSLGWSKKLAKFDLGLAGKILYEKIHLSSASGWAADFGAQYSYKQWRFGAAVLNWGADMKFDKDEFPIATQVRAGASWLVPQQFMQGSWLFLADIVKPEGFDSHLSLGMEYNYQKQFSARLGYKTGQNRESNFAFGLGIKVKKYAVDYAFIPFKSDLGSSHQIALILGL